MNESKHTQLNIVSRIKNLLGDGKLSNDAIDFIHAQSNAFDALKMRSCLRYSKI
jgi:hypothetical protein